MSSSFPQTSVELLLRQARAGDNAAKGQLLEGFRPYLQILARIQIGRKLKAKADPGDVVQETFLDAHRQFPQFRGETADSLAAWLRTILAGKLAQLFRRYLATEARDVRLEMSIQQDLDSSSERLIGVAGSGSSPSESVSRREELSRLAEMLEKLPSDYRDVILLRQIDGMSFAEVAKAMDRTEDSVQKLWVRGLQALRGMLGEHRAGG